MLSLGKNKAFMKMNNRLSQTMLPILGQLLTLIKLSIETFRNILVRE
jgi:hypothetical protein